MGRRAKNKQGAPPSLASTNDSNDRPSAKKLGKRKAGADIDANESLSKRPVKKVRENDARPQKTANGKTKTQPAVKGISKARRRKDEDEDEDEGGASSGSGEGWEGISDDEDLSTNAKYVSKDVLVR